MDNLKKIREKINLEELREYEYPELDSDNKIYYVLGELKEEGLETDITIDSNFCITVNMDFANNIFSIIPFGNGGLFDE